MTMLTQKGYLVAVVDNRGTPAARPGVRKAIYGQLGSLGHEIRPPRPERSVSGRMSIPLAWIWGWSYGCVQ